MVDLHTRIREQSPEVLEAIAKAMDIRANEPRMRTICEHYLRQIPRTDPLKVLEVGCGNGAATELIILHLDPKELLGVDPSAGFIDMARKRFQGRPGIEFATGDAVDTGQPSKTFDLVIAHTVFSHLPDPVSALNEAHRILKSGGRLVVFDGDYATTTVSLFDGDPLQTAADAALRNLVHDPFIMRRLPAEIAQAGFEIESVDAHGYVQTATPEYLLTFLARGLTAGVAAGEIGSELVDGLVNEARSRVEKGTFYGAILFLSVVGVKP